MASKDQKTPRQTIPAAERPAAEVPRRKLPAWIIIPILAAVFLLAWGVSLLAGGRKESSAGTTLNVTKVEEGTVKETYNSNGTIESENTKTYYSPVTAPIKECKAVVGQSVKAGDLLITFDTTNLERDNQQAQLTLQSSLNTSQAARAQNAKTIDAANAANAQAAEKANALAGEANALAAKVNSAYAQYQSNLQAAAQQSSQNAPRIQKLREEIKGYEGTIASAGETITAYERGYTGRQVEINEALEAVQNNQADAVQQQIAADTENYRKALQTKKDTQALLDQANASLAALEVPEADDAGYTELKARYDAKYAEWVAACQAAGAVVPETGMTSSELANLDISDNLAELAALTPEELLKKGREGMKADMDGVIASVDALQSNSAAQGMALFTIADTDHVRVKIEISPDDYEKMRPGSEATVTLAGNTYKGTLTDVDKIALPNAKGTPVIGARIRIDNPDENICIGATAKVTMTVAESKNVLVVPTETINASSDGDFVYVIEDGVVKERPVRLGTASATQVEITEGLREGDLVVNDLNVDIHPGMKAVAKEARSE